MPTITIEFDDRKYQDGDTVVDNFGDTHIIDDADMRVNIYYDDGGLEYELYTWSYEVKGTGKRFAEWQLQPAEGERHE